jgi:hypothetical protein
MSKQSEIREQVTAKIVAALEQDILPWRRPWVTSGPGRHTNVVSKKPYSGVNPLLLEIHAAAHGLRKPRTTMASGPQRQLFCPPSIEQCLTKKKSPSNDWAMRLANACPNAVGFLGGWLLTDKVLRWLLPDRKGK